MLVLEDIDTIVTSSTRSYFFNEVDGLENNDGILMIATTNHRKYSSTWMICNRVDWVSGSIGSGVV